MKRLLLMFIFSAAFASGQDARPIVAVLPFESSAVGEGETKTIESLVQSYVSELGDFRLVTPSDREKALSEQEFAALVNDPAQSGAGALLAAQYLLSGRIGTIGEDRVLTLQAVKVKTGEKKIVSAIYRTMSELALGTRSLVLQVFERGEQRTEETASAFASTIREEDLTGAWRGDKGIELVRIFRGGRAVAVFSSGVQMDLVYRIRDGEVRFAQTSQNTARFYHPVPYAVAQELVKSAKPMEWFFRLAEDGSALQGTKTATAVLYEGSAVKELLHDSKREAEWTKAR